VYGPVSPEKSGAWEYALPVGPAARPFWENALKASVLLFWFESATHGAAGTVIDWPVVPPVIAAPMIGRPRPPAWVFAPVHVKAIVVVVPCAVDALAWSATWVVPAGVVYSARCPRMLAEVLDRVNTCGKFNIPPDVTAAVECSGVPDTEAATWNVLPDDPTTKWTTPVLVENPPGHAPDRFTGVPLAGAAPVTVKVQGEALLAV
jgi:hypothetical protein